jgi:tetratricopeptide (TPR) repeat protein
MIPRQDRAVTYADSYRDSVQVFAREEYARALGLSADESTSSEISRYWLGRGLDEIRHAPLAWGRLMARKAWFLLWNHEIPNNRSYQWASANESRVLRWLPVRWWLLISLAPLGAASLWVIGRRRAVFWVVSFAICWSASLVLFFVNSRFRAPLWPFMCILAAAGGARLVETLTAAVRKKRAEGLLLPLATTLALATFSLVNWLGIPELAPGRDFFYRSVASLELGRLELARDDAQAALAADRTQAMHHFQLASVYLAENRPRDAIGSLGEAGRLKPNEPRIWNNLGVALEELDRTAEAYANYLRAIEQKGDYAPALANAALLELRSGRIETASAHLEQPSAARDTSVHTLCASAFLARAQGRYREAETLLDEARTIDSEIVDRLEEENRKPVSLDPA